MIQVHRVGFMDLVHMVGEVVQGSGLRTARVGE
jgi:hypothetical protein